MNKRQDGTKRLDGVLTCISCGWHKERWEASSPSYYCLHPANVSLVCGSSKGAFNARAVDGCCGPNADLHTSRGIPDGAAFAKQ